MEEKNWLPEKYRNDKAFEKFKDVEGVLDSYKNLEGFVGNSIRRPKPDDPEGLLAAIEQLGAPKSPDAYKIGDPNNEALKTLQKAAHEAKLFPNQWEKLASTYDSIVSESKAAQEKQKADLELQLRQSFGDKYEAKMELAKRTLSEWGDSPKSKAYAELSKINPKLATEMVLMDAKPEDTSVKGNPGSTARTKADIETEMKKHYEAAYKFHDQSAYARIRELQEELNRATA